MLWFSSGGTKSVLHNDYAENIMCVFRGTKEFFMVDKKYQELVRKANFILYSCVTDNLHMIPN